MKKGIQILVLFLMAGIIAACNKEKRFSKKLKKGEKWELVSLKVNEQSLGIASTWQVHSSDIYEIISTVEWRSSAVGASPEATICEWQFQEKGKKFRMQYLHQSTDSDGAELEDLDYVAYQLTGTYEVLEHKKKSMHFRSSETLAYPGQVVDIELKRIE